VKILQISSAKNFGGGEKHLVDLCRGLTGRGHEIFVIVRPHADWLERLSFLPDKNLLKLPLRNSFDVFSSAKIARFIRAEEIEIVHAHVARDYPLAALAVRLARRAKLILTRHVLFPVKSLHKLALSNVAKAIAVSSAVEANLQKIFDSKKIVSIPNGIEIGKWSNANRRELREAFRFQHDIPLDALLIGTIGELKPLKGQEDFIMAAQIIAAKFPGSRFVVVGKDNSFERNFRRKLKRLVKVFGLEERFLWLDWVEDTAEILHSLDVFVSASHSESFGLSILEAMASGVGIVAAATEGAKELLENDRTGMIVPLENPVVLAEAVGELLKDTEKSETLGSQARKIAEDKFSLEKMIAETERIYQEVLNPDLHR
jgi:glycosyltransferase involved in cell wall biosynthesis